MSRFRDRTEDFKDSVRKAAVSMGYNESKVASTMASFIIHKPKERSPFTKAVYFTLERIKELDQFMSKHRKDYVDPHRTTEQEKDSIEQEITAFIKVCKEQIDRLENSIINEEANTKGWVGLSADKSFNAATIAHKHGVVLILSEKLHSVTAQFDQLRATRFQDIINRAMPRRKPKRIPKETSPVNATLANPESIEPDEIQAQPRRLQQQLLDDETQALQVELSNLLDGARQIETKIMEMSALNHLVATHVLQQSQQIEVIYYQALEATNNVELGNRELAQAIQRNRGSRTFLMLFFFVLTFSVLFLDWYS